MARPRMTAEERQAADDRQRRRVLSGLAACLRTQTFADTTVADVVAAASVSRSTFYAHFRDREDAFLALYATGADVVMDVIAAVDAEARDAGRPWPERVEIVASAYFRNLAEGGEVTRSLLAEVQSLGDRGRVARRAVLDRYVALLADMAREAAAEHPELRAPSSSLLLAGIGGMNELLLRAVEDQALDDLDHLTAAAVDLVMAIMRAPTSP